MKKVTSKLCLSFIVVITIMFTACNKEKNKDGNTNTANQEYPSTANVLPRIVTDIDGNSYDAVQIGNQVWMAENLRISKYADGTSIPKGRLGNSNEWGETPYYYIPFNNNSYAYPYGYLYNWYAVMHGSNSSNSNPSRVQGVCPNGWHVPSEAEWIELKNTVKNNSLFHCGDCENCIAKSLASTMG